MFTGILCKLVLEEWFLQLKKSENHRTRESPSSFQRLKSSVLKSSPCHSIRVNWHYLANIPCQIFFNELIWDTPRGSGNALMSRKSFHILGSGFSSNSALSPAVTKVNPSLVTISATLGSAAVLGERSKPAASLQSKPASKSRHLPDMCT